MNWRRRKPRKRVDSTLTARERCDSSSQQFAWPWIFFLIFHLPITQSLDMSQVQWKMSTAKTCLSFFWYYRYHLTVCSKKQLFAFESRLCCSRAGWSLVANFCSHMTGKFYFFSYKSYAGQLDFTGSVSLQFSLLHSLVYKIMLYRSHDHSEHPFSSVTFRLQ